MALSGSFRTDTLTYVGSSTIYFTFGWSATQSIDGNYSDISWYLDNTKSASGYVNGELEVYASSGSTTLIDYAAPVPSGDTRPRIYNGRQTSGSFRLYHDNDGSGDFWVRIRGRIYVGTASNWNTQKNTTFYLNAIPRASVIGTVSNFNFEDAFSVPITKYSDTFKDALELILSGTTVKSITDYTSGETIQLTDAELLSAYALVGTSNKSATATFKTTTKSGTTTIGTNEKTATGTIAGTAKVRESSSWKRAVPWVKIGGTWKRSIAKVRASNSWKRGL